MRIKLIFIWWRAWHHRNNIIFNKGDAPVDNSIRFLHNYLDTLQELSSRRYTVDSWQKGESSSSSNKCTEEPK
jgi:hypothetical protein